MTISHHAPSRCHARVAAYNWSSATQSREHSTPEHRHNQKGPQHYAPARPDQSHPTRRRRRLLTHHEALIQLSTRQKLIMSAKYLESPPHGAKSRITVGSMDRAQRVRQIRGKAPEPRQSASLKRRAERSKNLHHRYVFLSRSMSDQCRIWRAGCPISIRQQAHTARRYNKEEVEYALFRF